MTSPRNILTNCRGAYRLLNFLGLGDEVFLSFLRCCTPMGTPRA